MNIVITESVQSSVSKFKARILPKINKIDIEFEIGYCLKKINECWNDDHLYTYYKMCICFLRGQQHYIQSKK
jgi:hypothetical protein